MKIREIIGDCLLKLGYGTAVDMVTDANRTDEQNKAVNMLLKCASIVYSEIITNHFPNVVKETVTLTDGKMELSQLTNSKFVYALSLKQNGENRKIKVYPTYIESNFSGEGELEFVALLSTYDLDTELPERVPSWLLAEGVAAEYAYANNMIDAGVQSERKFRDGLSELKARGAGKYVRARRWE